MVERLNAGGRPKGLEVFTGLASLDRDNRFVAGFSDALHVEHSVCWD